MSQSNCALQRAAETPEGFLQTLPGVHVAAAPGRVEAHASGELLRRALLLQPEEQHEAAGGGPGCRGGRRPAATPRLLQVRNTRSSPSSWLLFFFKKEARHPPSSPSCFREECVTSPPPPAHDGVSQEVSRHCIIQARLLAYRTGLLGLDASCFFIM